MGSDSELRSFWKNRFDEASSGPFGRVAALVFACARMEVSLTAALRRVDDERARSTFAARLSLARELGLIDAGPGVREARTIRNDIAHKAEIPSLIKALEYVFELAKADAQLVFAMRETRLWLSEIYAASIAEAKAHPEDMPGGILRFDEGMHDRLLLAAASSEADHMAALVLSGAFLNRATERLIEAAGRHDPDRAAISDLQLTPKLETVASRGWIPGTGGIDEELRAALHTRNFAAHEGRLFGDSTGVAVILLLEFEAKVRTAALAAEVRNAVTEDFPRVRDDLSAKLDSAFIQHAIAWKGKTWEQAKRSARWLPLIIAFVLCGALYGSWTNGSWSRSSFGQWIEYKWVGCGRGASAGFSVGGFSILMWVALANVWFLRRMVRDRRSARQWMWSRHSSECSDALARATRPFADQPDVMAQLRRIDDDASDIERWRHGSYGAHGWSTPALVTMGVVLSGAPALAAVLVFGESVEQLADAAPGTRTVQPSPVAVEPRTRSVPATNPTPGPGRPMALRLAVRSARASSSLRPYEPIYAFDGDQSTAWCEGCRGDGTGSWLRADVQPRSTIQFVEVTGGWAYNSPKAIAYRGGGNGDMWELSNVVTQMEVSWKGGSTVVTFSRDADRGVTKRVMVQAETDYVKFRVLTVNRTLTGGNNVCLDGFAVHGQPR